jgi:hypothetical protein
MVFRCLPEIIGFSNELCYNNRLIPLQERKPGFGPAIELRFVLGGSATTGQRPVNLREAEEIRDQVRNAHIFFISQHVFLPHTYFPCFQVRNLLQEDDNKDYKRSIGIISLWNETQAAQARRIDKLLKEDEYISTRRKEHKIRCGTAAEFQGDEKDIILLSLVIGNEGNRKASTDEAGFNVAMSRARYSCVLFHSVTTANLKDGDLRMKLLQYFQRHSAASTGAKQTLCGAFEDLRKLMNGLEGYTVNPIEIKGHASMLQIGSRNCKTSCVFVFFGVVEDWEKEQEICYMLSRLDRNWKGFWLFDAIVRPYQCLAEIKTFLNKHGVVGEQIPPSSLRKQREDKESRRREEAVKTLKCQLPTKYAVYRVYNDTANRPTGNVQRMSCTFSGLSWRERERERERERDEAQR